jgi:hypothetical protein
MCAVDQHLVRWPARRCQCREDITPHTLGRPPDAPVVERLGRTVEGRCTLPPTTGLKHVHNAADNPAIIDAGHASGLVRQKQLQPHPLFVIQPKPVRYLNPPRQPMRSITTGLARKSCLWVPALVCSSTLSASACQKGRRSGTYMGGVTGCRSTTRVETRPPRLANASSRVRV